MNTKTNLDQFTDALVEESLQEAANTFFGQRREIETEIEDYWQKVAQLRKIEMQVLDCQKDLHFLLLRGKKQCVNEFYLSIKVDPEKIPALDQNPDYSGWGGLPFALTAKMRYLRLVYDVYSYFAQSVRNYMYGKYYADPEDKRIKKKTVNVEQMKAWCTKINEKIEANNINNPPSEVLRFCKRMAPGNAAQAESMATPIQYNDMDKTMGLEEINFCCALLQEYPDLPPADKLKNEIFNFAAKVYKENQEEVKSLLQEVKNKHK